MENRTVGRRSLCAILAAACLLAAVPAVAQDEEAPAAEVDDAAEGNAQGKDDARGNALWFIPGLLLPGVGMILPWVFSPTVPSDKLIGKSDEFVAAYRTAYIHRKKLGNFLWAMAGTGTTAVVVGTYLIVVAVQGTVSAATACSETIGSNCSDALSGACSDACSNSISNACSNITPSCSPSIGCGSLGFLPRAALAALAPP